MFGTLDSLPCIPFAPTPSPLESLDRLRSTLASALPSSVEVPRLIVKRDDAIGFAFGGNKVRKMRMVAADALARGADTLVTSGGVQSNHARVTAAAAAKLGLKCLLVLNGEPPPHPTANMLVDRLLGADVRLVGSREERAAVVSEAAAAIARAGGRPYVIPVGASTPLGAAGLVQGIREMLQQTDAPAWIVHATSSGGTQAGLVAGCALAGVRTRVLGISADESAADLQQEVRRILRGLAALLGFDESRFDGAHVDVDDTFVGGGYGVPTEASNEAQRLATRTEALFVDSTYTAKALAGLVAHVRRGRFRANDTVLFWHTGGQVTLFA